MELISKEDAIDAIAKMMPRSYTPDGSHPADEEIFKAQEIFADCIEVIEIMPPVQSTQTNCEYCHTDRDGYVFPLEKNSHAFIDRDKIVLKANGWWGEARIKYCPICGRRLTDG